MANLDLFIIFTHLVVDAFIIFFILGCSFYIIECISFNDEEINLLDYEKKFDENNRFFKNKAQEIRKEYESKRGN